MAREITEKLKTAEAETRSLLSDLARVKALFQLRAIVAVIGGGE